MKILFLYFVPKGNPVHFCNGIASLSAVLKNAGYETKLLALDSFQPAKIDSIIAGFKPGLCAFSTTSDQFDAAKLCVKHVDSRYHLPIIFGGVHATIAPQECLNLPGVIGVCVGEGEEAIVELCNSVQEGKLNCTIKNFWFKTDNGILKNPPRSLITDLDKLPFPDREIFDYQKIIDEEKRAVFMAGRGCPFQCTYCINHVLMNLYKGNGQYLRMRSVDNVLQEIREVLSNYKNIEHIHFHDDTFTLNKEWLLEFCDKYQREFKLLFVCNVRANMLDQEKVDALKRAGCKLVGVGIESGNEYIRNTVLKRGLTEEQIINAFRMLNKAGIEAYSFNMIGLPYEDENAIMDTIRLNRKLSVRLIQVSIFKPYKGTALYDICSKKGWISDRKNDSYFLADSVLNLPTISRKKLAMYYKTFTIAVKFPRLWPYAKILHNLGLLDAYMSAYSFLRYSLARRLPQGFRYQLKKLAP